MDPMEQSLTFKSCQITTDRLGRDLETFGEDGDLYTARTPGLLDYQLVSFDSVHRCRPPPNCLGRAPLKQQTNVVSCCFTMVCVVCQEVGMKLAERRAGLVGPRIPIASDCHHRAVTVPRVQRARGGASPWIAVCGVTSVGSVVFLVVAVFAALLTFAEVPLAAPRALRSSPSLVHCSHGGPSSSRGSPWADADGEPGVRW